MTDGLDPDEPVGEEKAPYAQQMADYFADLAERNDDQALNELRGRLRTRDEGTYDKHIVPRLVARALIRRGPSGIAELVAALPDAPGAIYPACILEALWSASKGGLGLDMFGVAQRNASLVFEVPQDTVAAAHQAVRELIAESRVNDRLFSQLLDFFNSTARMQQADTDENILHEARVLFAEATIRLTLNDLMMFEAMLDQELPEESYQSFLRDHPVFLDPLAAEMVPKQKLGLEQVTDFALRRLDDRWTLVEIEKPRDRVFTANRDFSASFTHAFGQVIDFQRWVEEHGEYARNLMPGIASPRGLLVIGRSTTFSDEDKSKLRRFVENSRTIDVLTYDDVLSQAKVLHRNLYYE